MKTQVTVPPRLITTLISREDAHIGLNKKQPLAEGDFKQAEAVTVRRLA